MKIITQSNLKQTYNTKVNPERNFSTSTSDSSKMLKGKIVDMNQVYVTIKAEDGSEVQGKPLNTVNAGIGQNVVFSSKSENGQTYLNIMTEEQAETQKKLFSNLLKEVGLKENTNNLKMLQDMIDNNLPLNKESILKFNQAVKLLGKDNLRETMFFINNNIRPSAKNATALQHNINRDTNIMQQLDDLSKLLRDSAAGITRPAPNLHSTNISNLDNNIKYNINDNSINHNTETKISVTEDAENNNVKQNTVKPNDSSTTQHPEADKVVEQNTKPVGNEVKQTNQDNNKILDQNTKPVENEVKQTNQDNNKILDQNTKLVENEVKQNIQDSNKIVEQNPKLIENEIKQTIQNDNKIIEQSPKLVENEVKQSMQTNNSVVDQNIKLVENEVKQNIQMNNNVVDQNTKLVENEIKHNTQDNIVDQRTKPVENEVKQNAQLSNSIVDQNNRHDDRNILNQKPIVEPNDSIIKQNLDNTTSAIKQHAETIQNFIQSSMDSSIGNNTPTVNLVSQHANITATFINRLSEITNNFINQNIDQSLETFAKLNSPATQEYLLQNNEKVKLFINSSSNALDSFLKATIGMTHTPQSTPNNENVQNGHTQSVFMPEVSTSSSRQNMITPQPIMVNNEVLNQNVELPAINQNDESVKNFVSDENQNIKPQTNVETALTSRNIETINNFLKQNMEAIQAFLKQNIDTLDLSLKQNNVENSVKYNAANLVNFFKQNATTLESFLLKNNDLVDTFLKNNFESLRNMTQKDTKDESFEQSSKLAHNDLRPTSAQSSNMNLLSQKALEFDFLNGSPEALNEFLDEVQKHIAESKTIARGSINDGLINQLADEIKENINLMNQTNTVTYAQVPVLINNHKTNMELYVFSKHDKNKKKKQDENSSALVALDLLALGHFEVYVQKNHSSIHCQFRIANEHVEQIVQNHIQELSNQLSQLKYSLDSIQFKHIDEKFTLLDDEPTDEQDQQEYKDKRITFDMRT